MKKGFTLIELLAVIVILAIISAIAIPIVIKVIDNVKINSLKISMSNIEKAVELYINKTIITENKVFTCNEGICKDELNNKLDISGTVPDEGTINITKSGTITYNKIIIDGYLCDKYNDEFVCNKTSKNIEESKQDSIIIKNTSNSLDNYKIYGNSEKENNAIKSVGDKTKNLFNSNTSYTPSQIININGELEGWGYKWGVLDYMEVKPNTTYTRSYDSDNHFGSVVFYDETKTKIGYIVNKGVFTTPEKCKYVRFNVILESLPTLMIVEGEYTQEEFEQFTYEPYNKYKIPVKVVGKNLFNEELLLENNNIIKTSNGYKVQQYPVSFTKNSALIQKLKVDLKPEISYTISRKVSGNNHDSTGEIMFNDKDTNNLFRVRYGAGTYYSNFSLTDEKLQDINSIYIYGSSTADIYFEYIQIEEGLEATSYEPYKEIITNIYLDEPLRKVGNYVDYIDYKNQKEVIKVGVINLSNETNFELIDNYFVLNLESYPKKDEELSMSNYLEYGSGFWFEGNKLKIKIEGINTIEELKTWLSNNDVEIYYPLSKSEVSDIELPEINLNKNHSNIMIDTTIKPSNMLIEYN